MHAKPDLRVFLKWMIYRSGSVITDVIWLQQMRANKMVHVQILFADGSKSEFEEDVSMLLRLEQLKTSGLEGKQLIDQLISDDWGPPPKFVMLIHGESEITIPYS